MKANRYMAAIVGAALAISFVLPGAVSAQDDDKWRNAFSSFQRGDYAQAETVLITKTKGNRGAGAT